MNQLSGMGRGTLQRWSMPQSFLQSLQDPRNDPTGERYKAVISQKDAYDKAQEERYAAEYAAHPQGPQGSMADRGNLFEGPIGRIGIPAAMAVFGPTLFSALAPGVSGASAFGSTGGIGEGLGTLPIAHGAMGAQGMSGVQAALGAAGAGSSAMGAFGVASLSGALGAPGMSGVESAAGGMVDGLGPSIGAMGGGQGAINPTSVYQTIGADGSQHAVNTYVDIPSGAERGVMESFSPSGSPTASLSRTMGGAAPTAVASGGGGGLGAGALGAFTGMSIPSMSGSPSLSIVPGAGTPANSEIQMPSGNSPITSEVMQQFSPSEQTVPDKAPGINPFIGVGPGFAGGPASGVENASGSGTPVGAKQGGLGQNGAVGNLIGNAANMMDKFRMPKQQQQQQQQQQSFGNPNVIQTPQWNNNNFQFGNDVGGMMARIRKAMQLQEQNSMIQQPDMQTTQIGQTPGQSGQIGMMGGR